MEQFNLLTVFITLVLIALSIILFRNIFNLLDAISVTLGTILLIAAVAAAGYASWRHLAYMTAAF